MDNPAYIVALALGGIMLLSVCYVYVRHQVLQAGGMAMSGFAVILVGMSVWKSIDISVSPEGFKAELEQVRAEAAQAKEIGAQNRDAALALNNTLQIMKTQDSLRSQGIYRGPLDGELNSATKQAIQQFQQSRSLPLTATLDPRTAEALRIRPAVEVSRLERIAPARTR